MSDFIFRANPKYWASLLELKDYICDPVSYIYWSAPQHSDKIKVGDTAYIWLGGTVPCRGVVATGVIDDGPRELRQANVQPFKRPVRVIPAGWNEADAKSKIKVGILLRKTDWLNPAPTPRPNGKQTVELI